MILADWVSGSSVVASIATSAIAGATVFGWARRERQDRKAKAQEARDEADDRAAKEQEIAWAILGKPASDFEPARVGLKDIVSQIQQQLADHIRATTPPAHRGD